MKEQFQPFYVGQEVEVITDHSRQIIKKGEMYVVTGVFPPMCNCGFWLVAIGIGNNNIRNIHCSRCNMRKLSESGEPLFSHFLFRALIPAFQSITFEKVIEKNPVSVC